MQFILSLAMTLTFGLAMFQCSTDLPNNSATVANTIPTNSAIQTATPDDGAPRITLADAKADYDAGRAIIVDARGVDQYKAEHIKGAVNIPLGDFKQQYKTLPKDKKIIVYCS